MNIFNLTPVTITLAIIYYLLPGSPAQAETFSEQINNQVSAAIKQHFLTKVPDSRLQIQLNPLHSSLDFPPCMETLSIQLPYQSGQRITARVNCPQPQWSLFVTGHVRQYRSIVVARMPIVKGSRLSASHLELREHDIGTLGGKYFSNQQDVVNRVARVHITADTPIAPRMLTVADTVRRGDPITIEARGGGVIIRTEGTAKEDGRIGDIIDVLNNRSGAEVRARITAPGKALAL